MTHPFRELETLDARVLGALQLVDAVTDVTLERAFDVRVLGPGRARLLRNCSGVIVVSAWSELAAHAIAFDAPPAEPATGSLGLRFSIHDPLGQYLPRAATLTLPREPAAAQSDNADSLFQPARVPLYPSANAATGANWSLLRVSLRETNSGDALGGALLRVRRNEQVMARGITDARGEALIAIVGVPFLTFSEGAGPVTTADLAVVLEAYFDSESGLRTPRNSNAIAAPLVDPSAIEARAGELPRVSTNLSIAARRTQTCALALALDPP